MKKNKILVTFLAIVMSMGLLSGCVAQVLQAETPNRVEFTEEHARQFLTWFYEEGTWRTLENANALTGHPGGFVTDASGRPSTDDIELILNTASLAVTSGGRTDWYMVLVTDTEAQHEIIGAIEGQPRATSEGTVTVLVFSERLIRNDLRTDEVVGFAPDRGYYNAGILTGYLNMASVAMGYGTRMFMTPNIPGNGFRAGERWLEAEHFLDGRYYVLGTTGDSFSTENMKFINAVVIGTPDKSVETYVTQRMFPQNWSVWDPAYATGDIIPTGDLQAPAPAVTVDVAPIGTLTDGVFTGSAPGFFASLLSVEVTVANGAITSIEVTDHQETILYYLMASQGVGDVVGVIPQIIASQNIDNIDIVAGATGTSTAIIRAVADALNN
jgi:uncharacterized protein with FMN-binding domain